MRSSMSSRSFRRPISRLGTQVRQIAVHSTTSRPPTNATRAPRRTRGSGSAGLAALRRLGFATGGVRLARGVFVPSAERFRFTAVRRGFFFPDILTLPRHVFPTRAKRYYPTFKRCLVETHRSPKPQYACMARVYRPNIIEFAEYSWAAHVVIDTGDQFVTSMCHCEPAQFLRRIRR